MEIRPLRIACLFLVTFATVVACKKDTHPPKMVVINIRGTSFIGLQNYTNNHPKGYLSSLLQARKVRELMPVNNAVTATSLAAFETGQPPQVNGVLAHQFATKANDSFRIESGFRKYEVASFLEKADRAGKSVLNLGSLLLHGATEEHNQLHALAQGQVLSAPQMVTLDATKEVKIAEGYTFQVFNDNSEIDNRSQWAVGVPGLEADTIVLQNNQWTNLHLGDFQGLKIRCRVKLLVREGKTDQLFVRSAFVNRGYPLKELQQTEKEVGGAVGWPSIGLYLNGQIDVQTIKEEIQNEVSYVLDIFELKLDKGYDLITMDYPVMDRYGHLFSLSPSSSHTAEAYALLEKDLERLVKLSQNNGYQVMIQSGHGFAKAHTEINLNDALDSLTNIKSNQILPIPGKISAHLYLGPDFSKGKKEALIHQISLWKDSKSGASIIEAVCSKEKLDDLGLLNPNAGDIYVLLKPGYLFSSSRSNEGNIFKPAQFRGDHGYTSSLPENRGVLLHPGLELPDSIIHITDLAGFILNYLAVQTE